MEYTQLTFHQEGRVAVITLDHPPVNAFSKRLIWEVLHVLDACEGDDSVRVVMLRAEGRDFSVGADAGDIRTGLSAGEEINESFSELGGWTPIPRPLW